MQHQDDQFTRDNESNSDFVTAFDPDDANESSSMIGPCPNQHQYQHDSSSTEQQAWLQQGPDAFIGASPGTQHPYYTMDMQSPPADNVMPDELSMDLHADQDELEASYSCEDMNLEDIPMSQDSWADEYTNNNNSTNGPPSAYFNQAQIRQRSLARSVDVQVPWQFEDWTFVQPVQQHGERPSVRLAIQYPGDAGMGYSTSGTSHGPMSSNVADTPTTNTSWDMNTGQNQLSNSMTDSLATLIAFPQDSNMSFSSHHGSGASVGSVYLDSFSGDGADVEQNDDGVSNHVARPRAVSSVSSQYLTVPFIHRPGPRSPSPAPSFGSETPSTLPDVLLCKHGGCPTTFTGAYRRGNLHRHMRLKHGKSRDGEEREYPCLATGCTKIFKRQDSRLKHIRKQHPDLGAAGPRFRK